jgi:uncharacterized protein YbaR (Trm112 family)
MPVCTSCNIEYEEGKKFCNYCGGSLTPKSEPMSAPKKVNRADEEKSEGKLFCPQCKITYEFGSSCIQCGSPLGRQAPSQAKEEPEAGRGIESEQKLPPVETSQEQKIEAPRGKLICPSCKIIYEGGTSCIKCESALVPQTSVQTNGALEISNGSEVEGKPLQVQTMEEQLVAEVVVETPRKKLICPSCKIIYERGTSCVRCGSALVPQTASKEKEKPKSSDIEFNLPPSEPDGLEDGFFQRGSTVLPEASDRGPGSAPEQPSLFSLTSPKEKDSGVTERGKKRESRTTPAQELGLEEDFFQAETPEQPVAKKSKDDSHKRVSLLDKLKKDYRRLGIEVGSIMIMVLAGGYLLWSVYSYFTKPKPPEPRATISKEVAIQTLPSSSSSTPPAAPVVESRESKSTEGSPSTSSSSISKEAAPAPPPLPEIPKTPSVETQEIGNIKTLLENVRQSNLKKDIDLFVSCYSSDFENREGRKRATIAYWEKFNYLDLSYDLKNLSISVETAKARVEWLIKTSSRDGGQAQQNKSILDVAFKKEEGRWKIKEVKPAR